MRHTEKEWAENIFAGDRRAIARAISAVEKGEPAGRELLKLIFERTGNAFVIGVTGAPGAGKSTLVEKLAAEYRRSGVRVGIIAVDPSSPFSGGAILGDRIRMQTLSGDEGVYIRSMATHGQLGGLAPAAHDAVSVLDAAGCGVVILETVGVGQDEVDVARLAQATLLLLVPGMGDDIQTFKAGVMEIADLFVINKADLPGAERVEQEITAMLAISRLRGDWRPPILRTVATTGNGIASLREKLDEFRAFQEKGGGAQRRRDHSRARLLELLRQALFEKVVVERLPQARLEAGVDEVVAHRRDPHSTVENLIAEATAGDPTGAHVGEINTSGGMKIHHVGIAVKSLTAAVAIFAKIVGQAPDYEETVGEQKVRVAVFELASGRLELLEATAEDSPVGRFIAKRGQGIHHLTLTVPDIKAAMADLEGAGITPLDREPRVGAGNESIAFLDPRTTSGVLIELVETK